MSSLKDEVYSEVDDQASAWYYKITTPAKPVHLVCMSGGGRCSARGSCSLRSPHSIHHQRASVLWLQSVTSQGGAVFGIPNLHTMPKFSPNVAVISLIG